MKINIPLVWVLLLTAIVLLEGIALGRPADGDTLSEVLKIARWDGVGRFVLLPLWTWLSWHWMLRPESSVGLHWADAVAVAVGLVWALAETLQRA